MITPTAPLSCAIFALYSKLQVPRSITATLPATAAALTYARVSPAVVAAPFGPQPSLKEPLVAVVPCRLPSLMSTSGRLGKFARLASGPKAA